MKKHKPLRSIDESLFQLNNQYEIDLFSETEKHFMMNNTMAVLGTRPVYIWREIRTNFLLTEQLIVVIRNDELSENRN